MPLSQGKKRKKEKKRMEILERKGWERGKHDDRQGNRVERKRSEVCNRRDVFFINKVATSLRAVYHCNFT